MPTKRESPERQMLQGVSVESKNFYSAGASFTTAASATVTFFTWQALGQTWPTLKGDWFGLLLSALIVLAYALVIPEPADYPNAGKMRLTVAEVIFGSFNAVLIFGTILGFRTWTP
jgi:hypothetical protein